MPENIFKGATISPCGIYRYELWRKWNQNKPQLQWIMLNPSTADANIDDPTIGRCINFSYRWGFGGILIHNLFAFRASNPKELLSAQDPVGPENDSYFALRKLDNIVMAWGTKGNLYHRDDVVYKLIMSSQLYTLGLTRGGFPRHPLYVPKDRNLVNLNGKMN